MNTTIHQYRYNLGNPAEAKQYADLCARKDLFDAKVHLLQSLATPHQLAKGTVFEHSSNGTWEELCPTENAWHFRAYNGRYAATVVWPFRIVQFHRTALGMGLREN